MLKFRTAAEKADLITEYIAVPHGKKTQWRQEHNLSANDVCKLKRQYFGGDLDRDLTPRTIGSMDKPSARLVQLERLLAQREEEIERLHSELDKANQVNDALGKAIGLVEKYSDPDGRTPNTPHS